MSVMSSIHQPIKNSLTLLKRQSSKVTNISSQKIASLRNDCDLLSHLFITSKFRDGNLGDFFAHDISEHGKSVVLAANGRCKSPGNNANYCTYSLTDHESNKILYVLIVDKREVRLQSPNMQQETFSRSMSRILELVDCPEIITDASSSVCKIIGMCINVEFRL